MKKIFYGFILVSLFLVACNKANNDTSVAAPPPPTTQCIQPTTTLGYNNYGAYNSYNSYNSYNPYNPYNSGLNTQVGTCNSAIYNQYNTYGFSAYPYTSFNSYNWGGNYSYMPLCDCPVNTRPVYQGVIGLGCITIQYFEPIAVGAYYWSLTPNNYQWVNWTQVSNTPSSGTLGTGANNCYQQVAQACFTDVANSCGNGFICQPTAGGSRLGICRR